MRPIGAAKKGVRSLRVFDARYLAIIFESFYAEKMRVISRFCLPMVFDTVRLLAV